jgi:hypothetical protein
VGSAQAGQGGVPRRQPDVGARCEVLELGLKPADKGRSKFSERGVAA